MKRIITDSDKETRNLGNDVAKKLRGGEVICLDGQLGGGKTTFTQGLLEGIGAKGPYTSPTFVVMKHYDLLEDCDGECDIRNVYHVDAYRINAGDILELGWEEFAGDKKSVVIVEWPEKIKRALPEDALWIRFSWLNENSREIVFDEDSLL
ncbi:tRNA (adenosine(37)-N6)-threonylcarbamoyltransferase complex ATPase subunit type 1 TsaE [Patescibacteria group bacterium]